MLARGVGGEGRALEGRGRSFGGTDGCCATDPEASGVWGGSVWKNGLEKVIKIVGRIELKIKNLS